MNHFKKCTIILLNKNKFLLFLFLGVSNIAFAQHDEIILGRPTDTSVTASVMFTNAAYQYYLQYGLQPGVYNFNTPTFSSIVNVPEEHDFNNLIPNTRYYYRMQYKLVGGSAFTASPEYSFITQRAPASTFSFTIETDEHLYDKKGVTNLYRITLANEANDKPDFMFSLGDIFGDDHSYIDSIRFPRITDNEVDSLHKDYRRFLGLICHSIPFYIALGNHEGERKYYLSHPAPPNNLAIYGTLARKKYYPNPFPNGFYSGNSMIENYGVQKPENYYAWTWGDALFVVLDPYRYDSKSDTSNKPTGWDWTLGLPQYLWLKSTLENSTSKYKFVFAHHIRGEGRGGITNAIQNEWGGYQRIANGTVTTGSGYTFPLNRLLSEGWTKPIHQLFRDNNVNIFFQGHDHVFAHEILDSITYQSCPMAADSTYEIGKLANAGAYLSDTLEGAGHIKVTVSPGYVQVDYVRAYLPADTLSGLHHNGEIAFSYKVRNKNTYTFIGNGNWSDVNNWVEKIKPPTPLPSGASIYIEPIETGQCVLDLTQTISLGAKIIVNPNRKFIVPGVLNIQQ